MGLHKHTSKLLTNEEMQSKGKDGEDALNLWLQTQNLPYLYVAQSTGDFASLFTGVVKRPDFLVLLDSIGLIAVDVKNYAPRHGGKVFTLGYEKELKKVLAFERLFRIPVWYAYMGDKEGPQWYWISALKAVEVGSPKKSGDGSLTYLEIKKSEFCEISENKDLGKLYTQRLPGAKKVADLQQPPLAPAAQVRRVPVSPRILR